MNSLFGRWFGHRVTDEVTADGEGFIPFLVPVHWLDVTPVESTDKPCILTVLDVQARVCGLFAEVTQTITVFNPNRRPISASFSIPLPDRATVCGYALDIDGQMVDGVVVGKEKARIAFETEQRRMADPGLVEAVKGNVYRTRVYPVPSHGVRTVMLRYVAPLMMVGARGAVLDLPMPAEHLERRSLRIEVEMLDCPAPIISGLGSQVMREARGVWDFEREDYDVTSNDAVRIAMPELPSSFVLTERDEEGAVWFCASDEVPRHDDAPAPDVTHLTVLWDASGSRGDVDHEPELELVRSYAAAPSVKAIDLVVFSDTVNERDAFDSVDELIELLRSLHYDGGTNFAELSRSLKGMPGAQGGIKSGSACVLFSDGLDTISLEAPTLPEACDVVAIVSGSERDTEALRQACRGLAVDLAVAPKDAEALAKLLSEGGVAGAANVQGTGIANICDVSAADGSRRAVIGRLVADQTTISLGKVGPALALDAQGARQGSVLARAWASRRVAQLSPRADEFADDLLKLGRRFGVVSPVTSLLVLESLDQWLRYDIEPPKTWERMHAMWARTVEGQMRLFSREGAVTQHRSRLASEWADLKDWWCREYARPAGSADQISCTKCGAPLPRGSSFCPFCGNLVEDDHSALLRSISALRMSESGSMLHDMEVFEDEALADYAPPLATEAAPAAMPAAASAAPRGSGRLSARERILQSPEPMESSPSQPEAAVQVKAWMPNAPYLKALDQTLEDGREAARETYFSMRDEYRTSPSFFLDCAGWFLAHDDDEFGTRVLTNLAEMRIEDAALLRVMAWRLREAGRLEEAVAVLRRVQRLRTEDSQSHRDVALVLSELARKAYAAGDTTEARAYAEEAAELYRKTALTPWQRHPMSIALFAVEEYNVLRAWAESKEWDQAPQTPSLGDDLEGVLDCDLRITLAWDADETDVDIHVTEPTGEEAYYAHRRTYSGGRVSEDITDGYGPELYEVRRAMDGTYLIRAHYFASHQQAIFGPATCTLTVYTNWGRPEQEQQITTTRLDRAREMVTVGTASYGAAAVAEADAGAASGREGEHALDELHVGMASEEVRRIMGDPDSIVGPSGDELCKWEQPNGKSLFVQFHEGVVTRILERYPWGEENIVEQ